MTSTKSSGRIANYYWIRFLAHQERADPVRSRRAEIKRRLRSLLIASGNRRPPANLEALHPSLQVQEVRRAALPMQGRLLIEKEGIVIEIDEQLSSFESRFTHAHELAHLILEENRVSMSLNRGSAVRHQCGSRFREVEELCDWAASEILLPEEWLFDPVRSSERSLAVAESIGHSAKCDPVFVLVRVLSLKLWGGRLIWFRKSASDSWQVVATYPEKDESYLQRTEIADASLLDRALEEETSACSGQLPLQVFGERQEYFAECTRLSDGSILSYLPLNAGS